MKAGEVGDVFSWGIGFERNGMREFPPKREAVERKLEGEFGRMKEPCYGELGVKVGFRDWFSKLKDLV
jgi:hypothetical protein